MTTQTKVFLTSLAIVALLFAGVLYTSRSNPVVLGAVNNSFGMYAPTNGSSTVATNASTVVLATSTGRSYAFISNDSTNVVYLSIGSPAVLGKGIRLASSTGTYEIRDVNNFQGPVYAISSATSNVSFIEK